MIRALMVDVDGVVVHGRPGDGLNWATGLEADLGLRADDLVREFFMPHWNAIVTGQADLVSRLAPVLLRLAPDLTVDDLVEYWFSQDSRLDAALLREISLCRDYGLQVHLATNQEHLRARFLMEVMGLSQRFDSILYSAVLGCMKPERQFFDEARRRLGLPAAQLLLIDDTAANVAGARLAGWNALVWQPGMSLARELRAFDVDYPSVG